VLLCTWWDVGGFQRKCYDPIVMIKEIFSGGFTNENTVAKETDGVFHAPQNLEKGGHGVSPCTMHHLKRFSPWLGKRCVSHTPSRLSSPG